MIGVGRCYAVEFHTIAVTAQQDFFYIKPAADKICIIESIILGVAGGASDAGDAQEELLDLQFIRVPATVTVGSGGNAFTPNPTAINDAAAGFTARINDTTIATTSATLLGMHSDTMNTRVPYAWPPAPEHRHIVANAQAWVCRLKTTPADSILMNGTCIVRELP